MAGVFYILSQILGVAAFALLAPAALGISAGDPAGEVFLLFAGLVGFVAGAVFFALRDHRRGPRREHMVVTVAIVWTVLPVIGAAPFALGASLTPLDAIFEAASGLTTTGATVFSTLADAGPAVIFWRSELQWLGGFLTLVTFAAILSPLEIGGFSTRDIAAITGGRRGMGRTLHLMRTIGSVYLIGTGACIVALFMTGLPALDAFSVGMSTVSTGGFMPHDGDLSTYESPMANAVVGVFMLFGATSIVWHRTFFKRRYRGHSGHVESYWVLILVVVLGAMYMMTLLPTGTIWSSAGEGLLTAASLISTTGYEVGPGIITALPGSLVVFFALVGGAALSTAGGLKLYRIGAMAVQSGSELHRLVFPNSVRGAGLLGLGHDSGLAKVIWANLALSVGVVLLAALVLSLGLPSIEAAFYAAVSAFANIGPFYAAGWQEAWPDYADFDALSKSVMIATMIVGRIEVFVFLSLFSIADWRA